MEFADGYEGVTHAGLLLVALDTGKMLLAQRAYDESDDPDVQETWEIPGGGLDEGEDAFVGACRELEEETGLALGPHEVVHGWRSGPEDNYQGFVVTIQSETPLDLTNPDPDEVQALGWYTVEEARTLSLRPEFAATDIEALVAHAVSGNEDGMTDDTLAAGAQVGVSDEYVQEPVEDEAVELLDEPDFDSMEFGAQPIPVHGVLAPEDVPTGDQRGFNAGAMTRRPLRLPFSWQKSAIGGHDGSVVTGSVDRLMRKDGLIHWEGLLMPSAETDELVELIQFFGQYGVSVDGDAGEVDTARTEAEQTLWFEKVRASGLTAVSIPAFHEAYVALGPHPEMPDGDDEDALTASGLTGDDVVGARSLAFKRGKGWVTNPKETRTLHRYWTEKGQPGYSKIAWGTPGDWTRAKALIGEKIAKNSPEKMKYLNQIISQWHFDALGYWPGELDRPGNKTTAQAKAEAKAKMSVEEEYDLVPQEEAVAAIEAWEPVLTASAGQRVLPPVEYFDRHPDTDALTIEPPDENGVRRVHGYAGEWGVCHVGFEGDCVEVPLDPTDGYKEFHLGRTQVLADGKPSHLNTGVITYKVSHRAAGRILAETPEQAHFDDIKHAWASVRLGEDERGVWFSGVVLPTVPEEDLVLIEASGQVSGEWRRSALRTLLAVNVPGFPVIRSSAAYGEDGEVEALVASAVGTSECAPTPAERMAALKKVDAETRFDALKKIWEETR